MKSPKSSSNNEGASRSGFFFARRLMVVPTWRSWLLFAIVMGALCFGAFRETYDFLAPNDPVPGGILVVEGYAWDDMLREAMAEFRRNHYNMLFVTGGPIDRGEPLSEYKTLPDLAVAIMEKMGMDRRLMQGVPCPGVAKDRTYASAIALRDWLREHHMAVDKINVMAAGFHARRSRLLFQEAFGSGVTIGVLAYENDPAQERQWWKTSEGVRGVIGEGLAFIYARFFFRKVD
jgi:hypothetical protein